MDLRTNLLVIEKFGQELKNSKSGYRLVYSFSDKIFGYSYAIQNVSSRAMKVRLNCSKSDHMLFSTPTSTIDKVIAAGETEFYMHAMAMPSKGSYKRNAECLVVDREE